MPDFLHMDTKIWTQAVMYVQQMLSSTDPYLQPQAYLFSLQSKLSL